MTGLTGEAGAEGAEGLAGLTGEAGAEGPNGLAGGTGAEGPKGSTGLTGGPGAEGPKGLAGGTGAEGPRGSTGLTGGPGAEGPKGSTGLSGGPGAEGPKGSTGLTGAEGAKGSPGAEGASALSAYAEFYALMPGDNAATVAVGAPVQFPRDGPRLGLITRRGGTSTDEFVLAKVGTYRVSFSVSIDEAGQLVLGLDSGGGMVELPYTVYGRATGTSQIAGEALVMVIVAGSALELRNPSGNTTALTVTPIAGGTQPVAASIVIQQLS